jgi:hypothetical protein
MSFPGAQSHPVIELLSRAQIERLKLDPLWYYRQRAEGIRLMGEQPLLYGYEPLVWKKADEQIAQLRSLFPTGIITLLILGGNRASKTVYAAKRFNQCLLGGGNRRGWCLQSTEAASRADQQGVIYDYLPVNLRVQSGRLRLGATTKVVYSRAGGFTENTFVLPNASQAWFKFYAANVKTLEGAELDFAWGDELIPPEWVEAIRFRLLNRNGVLLITFTPIDGYTGTVKEFLDGAKTLEWEEAPLLRRRDGKGFEKVPRVQQCEKASARIIYFYTSDNPYGNYEAMKLECENSPRTRILTRAYGVPSKAVSACFPMFSQVAHVISVERWEKILASEQGAAFQFLDPCSGRNWFMIWVYCTRSYKVIYREWPSYGTSEAYVPGVGEMGEWALPGHALDGVRGPAQIELGWSLLRYKEEMLRLEKDEKIFERWIDARYANTRRVTAEEPRTLIEELQEIGLEFLGAPAERQIFSGNADGSLRLINDLLYYEAAKELGQGNQPKLFVVETCPNTIYALRSWTGRDGQGGACKDPIDCVRMLVLSKSEYVDESFLRPKLPWMKQFDAGKVSA